MRVCIYARIDSRDQHVLDLQIQALRDYAVANGFSVTSMVSVLGTNGFSNQQTLQTILDMAKDDIFDAVLTNHPSRLCRDSLDYIKFVDAIKEHGKTILYTTASADIDDCLRSFHAILNLYNNGKTPESVQSG